MTREHPGKWSDVFAFIKPRMVILGIVLFVIATDYWPH